MLLDLKKGVLYGPVDSRRYGKSLGINLMPTQYKLCSFNCLYCHYGLTQKCAFEGDRFEDDMPTYDQVVTALEAALKSSMELDLITFSGNGEPTLHPEFPPLVDAVAYLRARYRPQARVALLSNATGLLRDDVRGSLAKIDLPVLKLDASTDAKFRAINRPAKGVRFEDILDRLHSAQNIYLQTAFFDGAICNTEPRDLELYAKLLGSIRPIEVHIYSIDRPVPEKAISLVSVERLKAVSYTHLTLPTN